MLYPGTGGTELRPEKLAEITLRYFAYYASDVASRGHEHDLEVVDVVLRIDRVTTEELRPPCFVVRVARIVGAAHGSDWYSNVLDLEDGGEELVLPPHVLVEEGKHASAPDRNADGWFTPGYDATRRVNDAWGVRDAFRNNIVQAWRYDATNAKDRCSRPRMAATQERLTQLLQWGAGMGEFERVGSRCLLQFRAEQLEDIFRVYRLEEAGVGPSGAYCEGGRVRDLVYSQRNLHGYLGKWNFCGRVAVSRPTRWGQFRNWLIRPTPGASNAQRLWGEWSPGYKFVGGDAGGHFMSFVPLRWSREVDWLGGWMLPRIGIQSGMAGSLDFVYTPSASRMVEVYAVLVGIDWRLERGRSGVNEWRFRRSHEFGFKVHIPVLNRVGGIRLGAGVRGRVGTDFALVPVGEIGIGGW